MNSISTPILWSIRGWLLSVFLLCLQFQFSALFAQPTVTDFKIQRAGSANYTTSFVAATGSNDASATALEVPVNTFTLVLELSEAVAPSGSNAIFNTPKEIADLLILKLGSGTGADLITEASLLSVASDINQSGDGKTMTVLIKLTNHLTTGNTYTLTLNRNKMVARADGTTQVEPFSAVFATAKAITVLPASPTAITICNSGNSRPLPPIAINEQSAGSFAVGSGTLVLAFNNPDFRITKAPTIAVIGAPGDYLLPIATLSADGKLELAYDFTAFGEVSGLLLSGMEVTSNSVSNVNGVTLKPASGYEDFMGMDMNTTFATLDGVNITSTGGPDPPTSISGFATVCVGGSGFTYVASPVAGVTGYHWKLPPGFTTTDPDATLIPASGEYHTPDNQLTVQVAGTTSPGNYTLQVKAANDCQISANYRNKTVTVAPAPNPQISLPATRFADNITTPVSITVTNTPTGGTGILRGDGVVNGKLYPHLLLPGKNYQVHYDYTINNCTATASVTFEVYDPDALVTGLQSIYCADENDLKIVSIADIADATPASVKLYSPGNTLITLPSQLIAPNTYEFRFNPYDLSTTYGAGTYRFEIIQISLPGITTPVTFNITQPPNQTVSGAAAVCGDGSTVYNYASSVPATGSDTFFWEILSGNGSIVGSVNNQPQVSVIWNNGSVAGTQETLRLTQIRNGCQTVQDYVVTIFEAPSPVITGKTVVCPGETTSYTLAQTGGTYSWSIKDNIGGTIIGATNQASVTVRWDSPGTVEVSQTLNGCTSIGSRLVNVETLPKITVTGIDVTGKYCVSETTPIQLTPVFEGLSLPADYLTAGRFQIKRVSGNKPATAYINLTLGSSITDRLVPAYPIQLGEVAINPDTLTTLLNLNAGEYLVRYVYQDPTKNCVNYSPEYPISIVALPALTFTGQSASYCGNDSPVVLSTFKNGVLTPVLPGFKVRNVATNNISTLNGTLLDPSQLVAGDYELYLELSGSSSPTGCGNTSKRDTTVQFSIIAPPASLRISAQRDFNQDSILFVIDTTQASSVAQASWNFGNLLANTKAVKYPVTPDLQGSIASTNYTLTVQNSAGCEALLSQTFKVDFSFEGHCLGAPTRFKDESLILNQSIALWHWDFGDGRTSTLQHPNHSYAAPGTYWVSLTVSNTLPNGNSSHQLRYTLRRRIDIFPLITVTSTRPYLENFEQATTIATSQGWISHGVVADAATSRLQDQSSWQLKVPASRAGSNIQPQGAHNQAWITDNGGTTSANVRYFALEQSYVESPCFDISALTRPMVSFRYAVDTDPGGDGVVLLYTIDDGKSWHRTGQLGEGIHWYNTKPILGKPGERFSPTGNADQQGWSGKQAGWNTARFSLDEVLAEMNRLGITQKQVRFRFALGSNADNTPGSTLDGFAFDDFSLANRNRQVLVEYFINESLSEAVKKDEEAASFATTNPETVSLHYHTDFPGPDSFNAANEKDPSGRAFFYGIRAVPRLIVDGEGRDSLPDYEEAKQLYSKRTLIPAPFALTIQNPTLIGATSSSNTLQLTAQLSALLAFDRAVVVQVALIDTLTISRGNGSNSNVHYYHHVVRQMLPDAAGTFVAAKNWQPGDSLSIVLDWNFASYPVPLDLSRLRIVAFVQDYQTKEVYQATRYQSTLPKRITGTNGVTAIAGMNEHPLQMQLYPNPGSDYLWVELPPDFFKVGSSHSEPIHWQIHTLNGQLMGQGKVNIFLTQEDGGKLKSKPKLILPIKDLPEATYLLQISQPPQKGNGGSKGRRRLQRRFQKVRR